MSNCNLSASMCVFNSVRLPIVVLAGCLAACSSAIDERSDCIKALAAAKRAGLPFSPSDIYGKPSKESLQVETLIKQFKVSIRKGLPTLGDSITFDLDNLDRKKKGLKELPRPTEPEKHKRARLKESLAILDEIADINGPRIHNDFSGRMEAFPDKDLPATVFDAAVEAIKRGDTGETLHRLRVLHKLIELFRRDATLVSVLSQQAYEMKYWSFLVKYGKGNQELLRSLSGDCLTPFRRPKIDQMLKDEFLQGCQFYLLADKISRATGFKGKSLSENPNAWSLPTDKASMARLTKFVKNWTFAYINLHSAKTGTELQKRYVAIGSKFDVEIVMEEKMRLGPFWADRGSILDKGTTKRHQTLQALGFIK